MGAQEIWLQSLITDTPQQGRELAITMARKSIAAIQTNSDTRKELRDNYATDTLQLIQSAAVIAQEFQTIAMANNFWKHSEKYICSFMNRYLLFFILFFINLLTPVTVLASDVCEDNQPKVLKGIKHVTRPQGNTDYITIWGAVI